jgi:hypothetical protein
VLLTGPSNAGLADPATWTAIALGQVTTALLVSRGDFEALRSATALQRLVLHVEEVFASVHAVLHEDEALERAAWRGGGQMLSP